MGFAQHEHPYPSSGTDFVRANFLPQGEKGRSHLRKRPRRKAMRHQSPLNCRRTVVSKRGPVCSPAAFRPARLQAGRFLTYGPQVFPLPISRSPVQPRVMGAQSGGILDSRGCWSGSFIVRLRPSRVKPGAGEFFRRAGLRPVFRSVSAFAALSRSGQHGSRGMGRILAGAVDSTRRCSPIAA